MPATSPESLRRVLLGAARRLVALQHGPAAAALPLTVTVSAGPCVALTSEEPAPPVPAPPAPESLPPLERAIVEALGERPLRSQVVAARVGRPHTSYFRRALSDVVEMGLARHTRGGYSRAVPPLPPLQRWPGL